MTTSKRYLGLDLGTTSVGWCLIEGDPTPKIIVAAGVRIFPEGMDRARGEKSLNQDRREARSLRRQGYRRARRKQKLKNTLQRLKLLPKNEKDLQRLFRDKTTNPYALRARALDEKLLPHELGRALYHLGQRRGYLSNRKTGEDKEDGKVAEGIGELREKMQQTKARTLGEYFAGIDPRKDRIRKHYTARAMYEQEFDQIWSKQSEFHKALRKPENRRMVHQAIFHQRPLKIQKHLIGECEFEPERRRAAAATLTAQDFRLWQNLNHLKVLFADGEERWLNDKERLILAKELAAKRQISWDRARKLLGFLESAHFNLEKVRKSGLLGNHTAALITSAIGKKAWNGLTDGEREQLAFDVIHLPDDQSLENRLRKHWAFDEESITKLMKNALSLPKGVMHLSHKAMRNILFHLKPPEEGDQQQGLTYDQACRAAGYDHRKTKPDSQLDSLPFPGKKASKTRKGGHIIPPNHAAELLDVPAFTADLRNPMVERALYQVRRVVNAIIRKYGKPDVIRVEMARDLKLNRKQREEVTKRQKQNEALNEKADNFLRENGIPNPTRTDKLKYRLWEECGHVCPYTGKTISVTALFGDHPQFDIEHIIPYTRCLDDSYMNKTLCYRPENERKGNQTPWEFYHGNEATYEQVLQRAKNLPYPKFRRFAMDAIKEEDDFVSQQLNETRYIARKTLEYLQQLGCDVQPVKGGTTALLRRAWGLNNLLGKNGEKTRNDHRHHAVDALVVALTDRTAVRKISRHASLIDGRLRIRDYPTPITDLRSQAEQRIEEIVVSHKPLRKIKGPLHDETLYAITGEVDKNGTPIVAIRKPVSELNEANIDHIRDLGIRRHAKNHLRKAGSVKKAFRNPDNPLRRETKNNGSQQIKKVRLIFSRSVLPIAKNQKKRHVWTRNNHHMEIIEYTDEKGETKWKGIIVTVLDARHRLASGQPAVRTDHGDNERFVMALFPNDALRLTLNNKQSIYRVNALSDKEIELRHNTDATKDKSNRIRITSWSKLKATNPKKMDLDILGIKLD